jgi:DNA polymerase III gamma/tau subunit
MMDSQIWSKIENQSAIISRVQSAIESKKWPQSVMFLGANESEKKLVAIAVAQARACANNPLGCGHCGSCLRIKNEQSENLIVLTPQGATYKIEQARELISAISLSNNGVGRTVIIEQAQFLNPQTANALLKVVEEPPDDTVFIFLVPSRDQLIGTLRSRSQALHFMPTILAIRTEEVSSEFRDLSLKLFDLLVRRNTDEAISAVREEISGREDAKKLLNEWCHFSRDYWVSQNLNSHFVYEDIKKHWDTLPSISDEDWSYLNELLFESHKNILQNADIQLTYENLIRTWSET